MRYIVVRGRPKNGKNLIVKLLIAAVIQNILSLKYDKTPQLVVHVYNLLARFKRGTLMKIHISLFFLSLPSIFQFGEKYKEISYKKKD